MCKIGGPSYLCLDKHGMPINLNAKGMPISHNFRFSPFKNTLFLPLKCRIVDKQKYFGTVVSDHKLEKFRYSWYKSRKSESKVIANSKKMLNNWAYKCSSFHHISVCFHLYSSESLLLRSVPKRLASGSTCPAYLFPGFWR